jgi:hypothetical protein
MVFDIDEICGADPEQKNQPDRDFLPDLKPEFCEFKDEGCDLAASCLKCPFPDCVYDVPRGKQRKYRKLRDKEINRLFKSGRDEDELAEVFKLSRRTIYRIINRKIGNRQVGRKRSLNDE